MCILLSFVYSRAHILRPCCGTRRQRLGWCPVEITSAERIGDDMDEALLGGLRLSLHPHAILEAYPARLWQLGNPLAKERNLRHFLEFVDAIITDCDESVRSGQFVSRRSPLFVTSPMDGDYGAHMH